MHVVRLKADTTRYLLLRRDATHVRVREAMFGGPLTVNRWPHREQAIFAFVMPAARYLRRLDGKPLGGFCRTPRVRRHAGERTDFATHDIRRRRHQRTPIVPEMS